MNILIRTCEVNRVKIKWLEAENLKTGLKIERINFNDDITLLVGLSGAGKTQILDAVVYSLGLAIGTHIRKKPYHATLGIEVDGKMYEWEYRVEIDRNDNLITDKNAECYFRNERLVCNDVVLFNRNESNVEIWGYDKIPTPKRDDSILVQYSDDDIIKNFINEVRKLYSIELELDVRAAIDKKDFVELKARIKERMDENKNTPFRIFSHLPAVAKLYIVKKYYTEIYLKIFSAVKELFMEIQDIDVVEDTSAEVYIIAIKVYKKILFQNEISNGMLKTIYYIVELYTMSENSLVLIDEFENGLGVNCIDILSDMLINEREDLQFIITSHHPKIIDGIPKEKWCIVDRDISVIKNTNSSEYGIGNSQHNAYFNLLNRWEYEGKI